MLFLASVVAYHDAYALDQKLTLSNSSSESTRAQIAVAEKTSYVVWEGRTDNTDVYFSKITSGDYRAGGFNLSNNPGASSFPRVQVENNNVYVVWYDYSNLQSDVMFSKSSDGGKNFKMTNLSDDHESSYNPWMAVNGDSVYVVWNGGGVSKIVNVFGREEFVDTVTDNLEIFLARSYDGGETFELVNLSNTPGASWNPRVVASNDGVYVIWNEKSQNGTDIFFSMSDDQGKRFHDPVNISDSLGESTDGKILVDGNDVFVAWNEKTFDNTNVFFSKSANRGNKFDTPINLSNSDGESKLSRDTSMTFASGDLFVVWQNDLKGKHRVFLSQSQDRGMSFNSPLDLGSQDSISPQIVSFGNRTVIAWQDDGIGNGDILIRYKSGLGNPFSDSINLSNDEEKSSLFVLGPQISLTDDRIYAVWQTMDAGNGKITYLDMPLDPSSVPEFSLVVLVLSAGIVFSIASRRVF